LALDFLFRFVPTNQFPGPPQSQPSYTCHTRTFFFQRTWRRSDRTFLAPTLQNHSAAISPLSPHLLHPSCWKGGGDVGF